MVWKMPRHHKDESARLRHAIEDAREELSRTANTAQMIVIRAKIAALKKRLDECRQ
jgi:primosomal protein N''